MYTLDNDTTTNAYTLKSVRTDGTETATTLFHTVPAALRAAEAILELRDIQTVVISKKA